MKVYVSIQSLRSEGEVKKCKVLLTLCQMTLTETAVIYSKK